MPALKNPRIRKIDIAEIKALEMAEDSAARMKPSAKRKILIGLFQKYRPGEKSPITPNPNEYILKADIEDKLEELALKKDVLKGKASLFEKHIFEQLWKEHQEGEEKNHLANLRSLQGETKSKVKNLLEQKKEGHAVSDEQNAAAVLEQLEKDQVIKAQVTELLRQEFEKGYRAKRQKNVGEAEKKKAEQIVYRLLTMRGGKVAKILYQELAAVKEPKETEKPKETNSHNYPRLETKIKEFQQLWSNLKAQSASEWTMLQIQMETDHTSYEEIDQALKQLDEQQQREKERQVAKMEEYLKGAFEKYQQTNVPLEKRLSMGRSLIALLRFIAHDSTSMDNLERISLEFLQQIRKDNDRLGSRTKSSRTSVPLKNPLKKAA